jgi:hypothetical protein
MWKLRFRELFRYAGLPGGGMRLRVGCVKAWDLLVNGMRLEHELLNCETEKRYSTENRIFFRAYETWTRYFRSFALF